ncbi:MAG: hypothetical protein ACPIOQ_13825 [Promethearchaeia archaeon]
MPGRRAGQRRKRDAVRQLRTHQRLALRGQAQRRLSRCVCVSCELPSTPKQNRLKMFQQCIKWVDHVCSRNANASDLSKPPWT